MYGPLGTEKHKKEKVKNAREKKMKNKQKEALALKELRKKTATKLGEQRPKHKRNRSTR